jgi:AraC-like DNA-binding protein
VSELWVERLGGLRGHEAADRAVSWFRCLVPYERGPRVAELARDLGLSPAYVSGVLSDAARDRPAAERRVVRRMLAGLGLAGDREAEQAARQALEGDAASLAVLLDKSQERQP